MGDFNWPLAIIWWAMAIPVPFVAYGCYKFFG